MSRPNTTLICRVLITSLALAAGPAAAQEALWTQTSGPAVADLLRLVPHAGDTVYALTARHVFRSVDDGRTWRATGLTHPFLAHLVVDTRGRLFASTRCIVLTSGPAAVDDACGTFRSLDAGETWQPILAPAGESWLAAGAGGVVFRTAYPRLLARSADGGTTWEDVALPAATGAAPADLRALAATPTGLVAAAANEAFYVSTDNGASWERTPYAAGRLYLDAIAIVDDSTFFGWYPGAVDPPLRRSQDRGATWTPVRPDTSAQQVWQVWVDADRTVYAATERGLYRSADAGDTWEPAGPAARPASAAARTAAGTLLAGLEGTVYRRAAGGWRPSGDGLVESFVLALAAAPGGALYAGTGYGLYRSADGGATWTHEGMPRHAHAHAFAVAPDGAIYAGALGNPGLYRLPAGRDTVEALDFGSVRTLAVLPDGTLLAAPGYSVTPDLYRSRDGGRTWETLTVAGQGVRTLAATTGGAVYAATFNAASRAVYRSDDAGDTWTAVGLAGAPVRGLAAGPRGYLFAGTENGNVYRAPEPVASWDDWELVYDGQGAVTSFAFAPTPTVFAGTADGVLRSTDDGTSWHDFSAGLPPWIETTALAADADGFLYAGTYGDGVFRSVAPVAAAVDAPPGVPPGAALGAAYPNPTRRTATIPFTLPAPARVSLIVYDLLGREVARLVDAPLPAGLHHTTWNAADVPAGLYLYRLTAGPASRTGRLLLVR